MIFQMYYATFPLTKDIGSSYELGTQLLVANHRNYIDQETLTKIERKIEEFQKMAMSFQNNL